MVTLLACALFSSALAAPFFGSEQVTQLNASSAATNASAGSQHEHASEARTNKTEVAQADVKTGGQEATYASKATILKQAQHAANQTGGEDQPIQQESRASASNSSERAQKPMARRADAKRIGDLMTLIQSGGPLPEPPRPTAANKPFFAPALQDFTQSGSPPDILAVSEIVARDMVMMGFWYRFKYGFKVFAELNNVGDRWVIASSCYFDMLANSYIMHLQTVLLYVGTMQAQAYKASDSSTWADAQLGHLTMRQAHFFFMWLYWQNTLDVTLIHMAHGNEVDPKYLKTVSELVAVSGWWAYLHWDITASFSLRQLHFDGKPWDSSKLHAALSYVFQRQFVWLAKSMLWAHVPWIPDELPFKVQLKKSENFHGFALAGLATAIVYHMYMAVHVDTSKTRYVGIARLAAIEPTSKCEGGSC